MDKHDLRQAAISGMLESFDDYDHRCGTEFMQWANAHRHSRIYGAMIDCLRKLQEYPRIIAKYRRLINPKIQKLQQELGRKPSVDDYCERYGSEDRAILEDKLFATGVFNQHQVAPDNESNNNTSLDALSVMEDLRKCQDGMLDWSVEDRGHFQNLVLSCIIDERERFAVYAYIWLQWNIRSIAKTKIMNCSISTALTLRNRGFGQIRATFTRQELTDILYSP